MGKRLRIGIIGTGGIAREHARAYASFDDVEIAAGCDAAPGRAKAFLEEFGAPGAQAFESGQEMLRSVALDGVSVCTPNRTHAEYSIAALEAGVHVLCEKPMSFTLQEAADMVKASRKAGKILTIGFQPRYDFMRQRVDAIIGSGVLGRIYYVQSGGGRRRGIPGQSFVNHATAGYGVLGDLGCYSIDECLHAIHYPRPLTVSAYASDFFGRNPKYYRGAASFDVDDFSVALIRLEGEVTFVFKMAWAMHADTLGDTLWLGTEGGIKARNTNLSGGGLSRYLYYTDVNGLFVDAAIEEGTPWDYEPPAGIKRFTAKDGSALDSFAAKVRDFCDAIQTGGPAPIPGEEILYNQAICDGIYRSAKARREVEVVIPPLE